MLEKLAKQTAVYGISTIVVRFLSYLLTPYYTRIFGQETYGIVRNHHYVVTVNSLTKIGKGIFDPEEEIVPGKNDEKDTYYVGARINILSWKIVNQNVNL